MWCLSFLVGTENLEKGEGIEIKWTRKGISGKDKKEMRKRE